VVTERRDVFARAPIKVNALAETALSHVARRACDGARLVRGLRGLARAFLERDSPSLAPSPTPFWACLV
jgi:hypothetical protein